jgi:4-alpha-glucanotransferase
MVSFAYPLRAQLGLLGADEVATQLRANRAVDSEHLLRALAEASCWRGTQSPDDYPALTTELSVAVHRILARSRASVMITQLDDLMEMLTAVNVPGTHEEHRNWQRRLRYPLEGLFERPSVRAICAAMREERPR